MADRTVGIVTINDDTNYGNRLQNFALQEAIRSLGWEPETLVNRPPAWDRALLAPRIMHDIRHDFAGLARRAVARIRDRVGREHPQGARLPGAAAAAIGEFARAHIDSSPHRFSEMPASYWADRYDLRNRGIGSGVESDVSTSAGHRLPGLRQRTTPDRLCRELRRRAGAGIPSPPVPRVAARHSPPVRARVRRPPDRRRPHRPRRPGRARSDLARGPVRLGSAHRATRTDHRRALRGSLLPGPADADAGRMGETSRR